MQTWVPWRPRRRSGRAPLRVAGLRYRAVTLFDGGVGEVEVGLDVLCFGVEEGEHDVGDLGWYLEVL